MKWISHVAIAAAITAVVNPLAVPAAVAGSTAPDWLELIISPISRATRGRRINHRGITHYLAAWVLIMLFAHFVIDWRGLLFWFAFGGAVHWICDSLTITGAPIGWWSDRRVMLFGGKVRTGGPAEYFITGFVLLVCGALIYSRVVSHGYIPFFPEWQGWYQKGLVDAKEWKEHRFNFL